MIQTNDKIKALKAAQDEARAAYEPVRLAFIDGRVGEDEHEEARSRWAAAFAERLRAVRSAQGGGGRDEQ